MSRRAAVAGAEAMPLVAGASLETAARLEPAGAERVGLRLRQAPGSDEETLISYDSRSGTLLVGRARSGWDSEAIRDARGGAVELDAAGGLDLRVFVDGSVIEVFAGATVYLTSRVYPQGR